MSVWIGIQGYLCQKGHCRVQQGRATRWAIFQRILQWFLQWYKPGAHHQPKKSSLARILSSIHGQSFMGRHYKHILGKRGCPGMWETAKCVPAESCTLGFLVLQVVLQIHASGAKSCTLGFLVLQVVLHDQKVALSDFRCFKWCFMTKKLQSRILMKHRVKHQKPESATFTYILHAPR